MRLPSPRLVAVVLNVGRVGIGGVAMAGTRGTDLLIGPEARPPVAQLLSRMAGARDIALGAATLAAIRRERPPRLLVALGTFCDAVDLVSAMRLPGLSSTTKAKFVAAAGPAVALGTWTALARWATKS